MESFEKTLNYLYEKLPMFQRIGSAAFKKDLSNTLKLCDYLENPQNSFPAIHIAGTNGKGSTAHGLAAVLQAAGYKTGLYTSPHLKHFSERIKINGKPVPEKWIVDFVGKMTGAIDNIKPSFFEVTVAMAFQYFKEEQVDIAVIETGLGGRLDSTNVIDPEICLITNIGMDHTQFLGESLQEIASEKAGIIKKNKPVVINEKQRGIDHIFEYRCRELHCPLYWAGEDFSVEEIDTDGISSTINIYHKGVLKYKNLHTDLATFYQYKNMVGVIQAIEILQASSWNIPENAIKQGLSNIKKSTGLKGRWQVLQKAPLVIADNAHNNEAIMQIDKQLENIDYENLLIIYGTVNDKGDELPLRLLKRAKHYIFSQASIPRAMDAETLQKAAKYFRIDGEIEKNVNDALRKALYLAEKNDLILITGSSFLIAELDNL